MAAAISSGLPGRPDGAAEASWSSASPMGAVPSVRVGPGLTALTRTPAGPYSAAQHLVNSTSAALLEPYSAISGAPNSPTIVGTLTITPRPPLAIAGASQSTRKTGA